MVDTAALIAEMNALAAAAADLDWPKIYKGTKVQIAAAIANGGVITYQVNGRSVTRSVAELREILKVCREEIVAESGGIISVLAEFGDD